MLFKITSCSKTKTHGNFEDAVVMSKKAGLTNKKGCSLAIP